MRTFGNLLRHLADKIDHDNAPRAVGWSFRFEEGAGIVWQEDAIGNQPPKGCRVWCFPKDYPLAHNDGSDCGPVGSKAPADPHSTAPC